MANTKQKGLFHHSSQPDTVLVNFNNQINDVSRRLRILEERYTNIRRKGQVVEQNMLSENKKVNTEIKTVNSDISDLKRGIAELKSKMMLIVKELQLCAKKEDVQVLEKYINLWEPINFVTSNEVEKIVKSMIEKFK